MLNSPLDFENMIWKVFSVGIISSVTILYAFYINEIPQGLNLLALSLGFSILVYSFLLVLGYGFKAGQASELNENQELRNRLDNRFYPRVRWIAEIIILGILFFYFKSFYETGIGNLLIPLDIFLFFGVLSLLANLLKRINSGENWIGIKEYFKNYFS